MIQDSLMQPYVTFINLFIYCMGLILNKNVYLIPDPYVHL